MVSRQRDPLRDALEAVLDATIFVAAVVMTVGTAIVVLILLGYVAAELWTS